MFSKIDWINLEHIKKKNVEPDRLGTNEWSPNVTFKINSSNATKFPSYRNESIDLQIKSIDWFLYGNNFGV